MNRDFPFLCYCATLNHGASAIKVPQIRFASATLLAVTALVAAMLSSFVSYRRNVHFRESQLRDTRALIPPECKPTEFSANNIHRLSDCWVWNLRLPKHELFELGIEIHEDGVVKKSVTDDVCLRGFEKLQFSERTSSCTSICILFDLANQKVLFSGGKISTEHPFPFSNHKFLDRSKFHAQLLPDGEIGSQKLDLLIFAGQDPSAESMRIVIRKKEAY